MKYDEIAKRLEESGAKTKKTMIKALSKMFPELSFYENAEAYSVVAAYSGCSVFNANGLKTWDGRMTFSCQSAYSIAMKNANGVYEYVYDDLDKDMKRAKRAALRHEHPTKDHLEYYYNYRRNMWVQAPARIVGLLTLLSRRWRAKSTLETMPIPSSVTSMLNDIAREANTDKSKFWDDLRNAYSDAQKLMEVHKATLESEYLRANSEVAAYMDRRRSARNR